MSRGALRAEAKSLPPNRFTWRINSGKTGQEAVSPALGCGVSTDVLGTGATHVPYACGAPKLGETLAVLPGRSRALSSIGSVTL